MSNEAKKTTKKVQSKHLYLIVTAALCAALIAVMTAFVKFNTGSNDGYLHFGDSMVYLAACILPLPYAMVAAAMGVLNTERENAAGKIILSSMNIL